jgi:hypothetical protein
MCIKQESNKILLQAQNKNMLWQKKTYPKLMLNELKVMGNSIFVYTHWHLIQEIFFKNFQPTCGPYSPMCAHAYPCVNYDQTKTQLNVD